MASLGWRDGAVDAEDTRRRDEQLRHTQHLIRQPLTKDEPLALKQDNVERTPAPR